MSWLVNSIANSLKLDDDEDNDNENHTDTNLPSPSTSAEPRGVKEDLSEISKTLSRQFWGVASFLAPPAAENTSQHPIDDPDADSDPDYDAVAGFRSDLSEIGGKFRTGISKLSSNKAVTEFTKIISTNFLQSGSQELESIEEFAQRGVVGVSEEIVAFARNLALHPETWIDFPLPDDDDDEINEDFDMSDAQQEHALAVERLAPALAALRIELCPGYMSEGCFWKIYFVLVHPRLSREDALLLSSPQIVKTRAMLTHDIKARIVSKQDVSGRGIETSEATSPENEEQLNVPSNNNPESELITVSVVEPEEASKDIVDVEMDKHPLVTTEIPVIDKQVIQEVSAPQTNNPKPASAASPVTISAEDYDEDGDDWLKEEPSEIGESNESDIPLEDPEDVSFSDLEEDDDDEPIKSKKVVYPSNTSKESSGWLDIEDIDVA